MDCFQGSPHDGGHLPRPGQQGAVLPLQAGEYSPDLKKQKDGSKMRHTCIPRTEKIYYSVSPAALVGCCCLRAHATWEKTRTDKFDDLRRGFSKDWLSLDFFQRLFPCPKDRPKKHQKLSDFAFLTSKWPQNSNLTLSSQHNLGVPKIFNIMKFSVWALLEP